MTAPAPNNEAAEKETTLFQLNTDAINCLQDGRYADAIAKLQLAMTKVRTAATREGGFRLSAGTGYGSQADNSILNEVAIMSVPALRDQEDIAYTGCENEASSQSNDVDGVLFKLFDMAFITVFNNYQGTKGIRLTCALLLYNLGLCYHHREVVSQETMNAEKLRKALKFYTQALRVIQGNMEDGRPEDVTTLILALLNNIGHLWTHFGNMAEGRLCLDWIRIVLSSPQAWELARTRTDMAFFYYNSMLVVGNVLEKAAAA